MRIGQAIDNVYQNNKLEYQSETLKIYFDPYNQSIRIRDLKDGGFHIVLSDNFKNEKFKLIQKPVSFMEAVASGKDFRVEHEDCKLHPSLKYMEVEDFIYHLYDNCDGRNFKDIILEGKFYIQEED